MAGERSLRGSTDGALGTKVGSGSDWPSGVVFRRSALDCKLDEADVALPPAPDPLLLLRLSSKVLPDGMQGSFSMPSTRISTRKGWIAGRNCEVIEAVQRALARGLLIPEHDRCIYLQEFDEQTLISPPTRGQKYTVIEITLFSGRSLETKRRLYQALTEEMAEFGLDPSEIKTILIEVDPSNWGLSGKPASEIDLGFKIDV